jgi:hypothetical protein
VFFGIALVLVVVLPLAVTTIAYERTKDRTRAVPVIRWPGPDAAPNRVRWRSDRSSGMTTGVLAALFIPALVDVVFDHNDGPPWLRLGATAALILAPLALYLALRPRGQYALGMAAGAALVGVVAPLVFVLLFSSVGVVAGWF